VSSVSISKEFDEVIKRNDLSPTEIFRKGLIVEASERGIKIPGINLQSDLIRGRLLLYKECGLLNEIETLDEHFDELMDHIADTQKKLIKIKKEVGSNDV